MTDFQMLCHLKVQPFGPQRYVNPAASLHLKSERWRGRASHIKAKAIYRASNPEQRGTLPGYGEWHERMVCDGTGETLLDCPSGRVRRIRWMPKSSGVQRESEEVIVPMIRKTTKLPVGKDLYLGHAST